MAWGGIAHGVKPHLIVVEGNTTVVRYKDETVNALINSIQRKKRAEAAARGGHTR